MALTKITSPSSLQSGYRIPRRTAESLTQQPLGQQTNSDVSLARSASADRVHRQLTILSQKVTNKMEMRKTSSKKPLEDKGFSRSTSLSTLYGVVVILVGLVMPMTEALRESWMTNHLVAVFLTYLYAIGSIFIIYLYIHESVLKKKHNKIEQREQYDSSNNNEWYTQKESFHNNFPKSDNTIKVEEDEELGGINNLGMDEEVAGSSTSSNTDDPFPATIEEDKPRITFYSPNDLKSEPSTNNIDFLTRSRAESVRSEADEQTPDDVFNYIVSHMGTASQSNEGTSFFLKGGSLIFAVANMVYVALRIEGEHEKRKFCEINSIIYPHYVHMLFIVMQTFFLLKNEFVLRYNKPLVRFGLAHLLATNLCVWLRFLMIEVAESLAHQEAAGDHGVAPTADNTTTENSTLCEIELLMHSAGPYLFPFVLEYSLVASSTAAGLFSSINIRVSRELYRAVTKSLQKRRLKIINGERPLSESTSAVSDKGPHHGPFSKSHTGLFIGVLMFAGVIVSMILFFHWKNTGEYQKAELCFTSSETIILVALLIAAIIGFVRFSKFVFDVNDNNTLDHALLLISGAFYLVLEMFEIVSTGYHLTETVNEVLVFSMLVCIFSLLQTLCQTVFIVDGMQRVAVEEKQQRNKYGRGVITFLIVVNVAAWVFKSFQEKRSDLDYELEFFGDVAWTIISSVALPLVLFYRFHSSICLAHMWHHCYEKHDDHLMDKKLLL